MYAKFEVKSAWLSSTFGENLARQLFSASEVDSLGRYVRGTRKGRLRGLIKWKRVLAGGWVRTGASHQGPVGYVERRRGRIIQAELCEMPWKASPITRARYDAGQAAE